MFSKLCAIVAVLVIAASAFAAPGYLIENPTFATGYVVSGTARDVFYFDIVLTGLAAPQISTGFAGGFSLSADPHISAVPSLNRYISGQAFYPAAGAIPGTVNWVWDAFGGGFEMSNSGLFDAGGNPSATDDETLLMSFSMTDGAAAGTSIDNGIVLARVFYAWDGVATAVPDITVQGDAVSTALPYVINPDNSKVPLTLVPEPATMGLLGLGLVGLVIRRKK